MAIRTYGTIKLSDDNKWVIQKIEPHVCIRLKAIFPKINKTQVAPYFFADTPETCRELLWFMERYAFEIDSKHKKRLQDGQKAWEKNMADLDRILLPTYKPKQHKLKGGNEGRDYQLRGTALFMFKKKLLIGDDLGLGKTLIGVLSALEPGTLPMIVVVQTHLTLQWKAKIEEFTDLRVHIIKGTKPYSLDMDMFPIDIFITTYSRLAGWVDIFSTGLFKTAVFDECQELRRAASNKYDAAKVLSGSVERCLGLSATPIYNYGDEIFNVLNCLNDGCLGSYNEFSREWCGYGKEVKDPVALGTYLRESFLMLRRTREEVGRELPPINKIVHTVEYNEEIAEKNADITRVLAIRVLRGSFTERGQAARELDMMVRRDTGVGKAVGVAHYVRILLENNEPVVLAGWHRDVYDIWLKELAEFNPVMYTGTESPTQKLKAVEDFVSGKTNLFIISLRSGIGLDGLQHRCRMVVIGELDWSPKVHDQLIARVDRDMQKEQVTAIFLVCDDGSDPLIINMLGIKSSQSYGIVDPLKPIADNFTDESRMKKFAELYLQRNPRNTPYSDIVATLPTQ